MQEATILKGGQSCLATVGNSAAEFSPSKSQPRILVIVPAYNEAENLAKLLPKLTGLGPCFDVLVINDASTDATSSVARISGVKVVDLPINLGIGGAVQTGFKYAHTHGYSFAIQVDGDGDNTILILCKR